MLAERDPAAAARVHPNDRRRVVRALELADVGRLARAGRGPSLEPGACAGRRFSSGSTSPLEELDARIEARVEAMIRDGAVEEAQRAWAAPLSSTARKVLGLEEFATLPLEEAAAAVAAATRRLARYQRKWLRRLPVVATLDAGRPPEEIADEIVALAGARERLSGR